jgi:REP-associated tyrosine transposase
LPQQFPEIRLHGHMVMPNHIHGIVEIMQPKPAQRAAPLQRDTVLQPGGRAHSLSVIVRTFKADVTRRARTELKQEEEIWQRNYFDRVIRDGREFANAMRYIAENPVRWEGQAKKWAKENEAKGKS